MTNTQISAIIDLEVQSFCWNMVGKIWGLVSLHSNDFNMKNINVRFLMNSGARIITIATPYAITENKLAKDYSVDIEELSLGKTKNILFRLSINKMQNETLSHTLLKVNVTYSNNNTEES